MWNAPRRIRTIPRCPLWGKCRKAAKGVSLVFLSCFHSTNHTPSVRPFGLPAPPSGSRGIVRIRLMFHKTVSACRETPLRLAKSRLTAVARLHGACGRTSQAPWACQLPFQGRFGRTNSLPPLGVVLRAANQDSNDCRWQSYLCFVPR